MTGLICTGVIGMFALLAAVAMWRILTTDADA